MGEAHFRTLTPPKALNQFRCHVKYITTSPQGVDVQNLVGIDSAVTDLRMREKTRFVWIFLLTIIFFYYLSIYLSVRFFVGATGHSFGPILTVNGSNDVVSQPLVPFDVTLILLPTKGVKSPKTPILGA